MLRSEIQADIASRFGTIIREDMQNVDSQVTDGYRWYRAMCRLDVGVSSEVMAVNYIVYDEGGAGEAAFYKGALPEKPVTKNEATDSFRQTVKAEIASHEAAGTIKKGTIEYCDEEKELAVVDVYMLDGSSNLVNRKYLAFMDNTETLDFQRIVQE